MVRCSLSSVVSGYAPKVGRDGILERDRGSDLEFPQKGTKVEQRMKWRKLKKEECCGVFREELRQVLGGQETLPHAWRGTANVITGTV